MFELYNFDENFKAYTEKWLELNKGKFKTYEQIEDEMPKLYLRWLNSPAAFLGGETPGGYFEKYDSAPELIKWLRLYMNAEVPVPDMLMDRITHLGSGSIKPLMYLLKDENNTAELRMTAMDLLKELDAGDLPLEICLGIIDRSTENDELADKAVELFEFFSNKSENAILDRLNDVNIYARERYLDILTAHQGDERIFKALLNEFENRTEKTGLFAALLGKYRDERAIPVLTKALDRENINYLDYIELCDAIESLGGEVRHERDFSGDEYYEALKENK